MILIIILNLVPAVFDVNRSVNLTVTRSSNVLTEPTAQFREKRDGYNFFLLDKNREFIIDVYTSKVLDFVVEVKKHIKEAEVHPQGKYMYYIDCIGNSRLCDDTDFKIKYNIENGINNIYKRIY